MWHLDPSSRLPTTDMHQKLGAVPLPKNAKQYVEKFTGPAESNVPQENTKTGDKLNWKALTRIHHMHWRHLVNDSSWTHLTTVDIRHAGQSREVALHRAWLVLRWMTICKHNVWICNQQFGPTQPPTLCGMGNEYQPRSSAVLCSWEGNRRSGVALAMHCRLCGSHILVIYPSTGSIASKLRLLWGTASSFPFTIDKRHQIYNCRSLTTVHRYNIKYSLDTWLANQTTAKGVVMIVCRIEIRKMAEC